MKDWLPEQLQTIMNLVAVAQILLAQHRREYLPTVLEILFEQVQDVVDETCVEREGD